MKRISSIILLSLLAMFVEVAPADTAVTVQTETLYAAPYEQIMIQPPDTALQGYSLQQIPYTEEDIEVLAKMIWGEGRGLESKMEQAALVWCALNRVDSNHRGDTISEVVTSRSQFTGYRRRNPVTEEFRDLAQDVLERWWREKQGVKNVGRVLPKEYLYFAGRNGHNWFRKTYKSKKYWDFNVYDPYEAQKPFIFTEQSNIILQ